MPDLGVSVIEELSVCLLQRYSIGTFAYRSCTCFILVYSIFIRVIYIHIPSKSIENQKPTHTHIHTQSLSLVYVSVLGIDDKEIQRQNRITAQIVANYLERRLFPFKRPTNRLPTVDEILPSALTQQAHGQPNALNHDNTTESKSKITRHLQQNASADTADDFTDYEDYTNDDSNNGNTEHDPEHLQSVESTHVDSYYPGLNESNEGRCPLFNYLYLCSIFAVAVAFMSMR